MSAADWLVLGAFVVVVVSNLAREGRLYCQVDRWRRLAGLWQDLRIMERAAEDQQSAWSRAQVERIRVELREMGERP